WLSRAGARGGGGWGPAPGGRAPAGLLHGAVRLTGHGGGRPLVVERSLSRLAAALGRVLTGFLPAGGSPTPAALLLGALAAGAAWLALLHARAELASEPAPPAPRHGVRATTILVVLAILLRLSPLPARPPA